MPCSQVQPSRAAPTRLPPKPRQNRRGIDGRKLIYKTLGRGPITLRLLHRFDDVRQRGVCCRGGGTKQQLTCLFTVPANTLSPGILSTGMLSPVTGLG